MTIDYRPLLERLAETRPRGITCAGKRDGGGAQVMATLSALLFRS